MKKTTNWKKLALRLARSIVRFDNYSFAGHLSQSTLNLARRMTKKNFGS